MSSSQGIKSRELPPCFPQFAQVNRYYDPANNCFTAKILPGEYYVTTRGEMITTVLGSCIAVCAYDPELKLGGMNHFMLPGKSQIELGKCRKQQFRERLRYGQSAIDALFSDLIRFGARKENLVVKVFGGAKMFGETGIIGPQNVQSACRYLEQLGYNITAQDVGLSYPRKVNFFCESGKVMIKRIKSLNNTTLHKRDIRYSQGKPAE